MTTEAANQIATEPTYRRFTADEYHRMAEAGILDEDDRIELIEGRIIEMSPIGVRHATCVARLTHLLVRLIGEQATVHIQNPVRLSPYDEPQPDVAVVRARDYNALPSPEDVLLLMEVSDATLRYDRTWKLPLYARAGIPECWLIDLQGETIERHTDPVGELYRLTERVGRGGEIQSLALPGLVLKADEILS